MSTFTALEALLPGRCHHMVRAFEGRRDREFWRRAARGETEDQDWREFIRWGEVQRIGGANETKFHVMFVNICLRSRPGSPNVVCPLVS